MKNKLEYKTSDKANITNAKIIPPSVYRPADTIKKPLKEEAPKSE